MKHAPCAFNHNELFSHTNKVEVNKNCPDPEVSTHTQFMSFQKIKRLCLRCGWNGER